MGIGTVAAATVLPVLLPILLDKIAGGHLTAAGQPMPYQLAPNEKLSAKGLLMRWNPTSKRYVIVGPVPGPTPGNKGAARAGALLNGASTVAQTAGQTALIAGGGLMNAAGQATEEFKPAIQMAGGLGTSDQQRQMYGNTFGDVAGALGAGAVGAGGKVLQGGGQTAAELGKMWRINIPVIINSIVKNNL